MDELTQTRLIVAASVGAIAAASVLSGASDRRPEKRFAAPARSLGAPVARESGFPSQAARASQLERSLRKS